MINSSVKTIKLSKQYESTFVLKNISFELPNSGVFGVLGRNGAGKTTLLAILMGLITPSEGEVYILNKPIDSQKYKILKEINL